MAKTNEVGDLDETLILSIGEVRELIYKKAPKVKVEFNCKQLNTAVNPHINFKIEGVIKFETLFNDGNIATSGEIPLTVDYSDIPKKK